MLRSQIDARPYKPLVIERNTSLQPRGVRAGAGHQERVANGMFLLFAASIIAPANSGKMRIAFELNNLGVAMKRNRGALVDAPDQVIGHRIFEPRTANQDVNMAGN